mmetsp:Transcript_18730/g.61511  ORF Transcript_18730/g.61511 Transcript_18730/m.61511 type:complete len:122 (-) Transcript_18730:833-1198(-)
MAYNDEETCELIMWKKRMGRLQGIFSPGGHLSLERGMFGEPSREERKPSPHRDLLICYSCVSFMTHRACCLRERSALADFSRSRPRLAWISGEFSVCYARNGQWTWRPSWWCFKMERSREK